MTATLDKAERLSQEALVAGDGLTRGLAPAEPLARSNPARRARAGSWDRAAAARPSASASPSVTSSPALPTTSGRLEFRNAATGQPHAIASRQGSPKPSYRLGNNRQPAAA